MRATCLYCREELRTDAPNVVRRITCWAENNKTGKPSKILSPAVDLQQFAHRVCHEVGGTPPASLF